MGRYFIKLRNSLIKSNTEIAKERSVSRFQEKDKRGEMITKMITLNDNINDNTYPVQGKMITQNDNICKL